MISKKPLQPLKNKKEHLFFATLGRSGPLLGHFWPLLGRSWPLLGCSWAALGRSWPLLGRSWACVHVRVCVCGPCVHVRVCVCVRSWPLLRRHAKFIQKSMPKMTKNDRFGLPKALQNDPKIDQKNDQKSMQKTKRKKTRNKTKITPSISQKT